MTMHVVLSYCCIVVLWYFCIVILFSCIVLSYCCVVVLWHCRIVVLFFCDVLSYCFVDVLWYCCFVLLFCCVDDDHIVRCYIVIRQWFCLFCQTSADAHEYMLALKECLLLAELKPVDGRSEVAASGEGYDETLHSSIQTFWDMFGSGQITQTVTCTICT